MRRPSTSWSSRIGCCPRCRHMGEYSEPSAALGSRQHLNADQGGPRGGGVIARTTPSSRTHVLDRRLHRPLVGDRDRGRRARRAIVNPPRYEPRSVWAIGDARASRNRVEGEYTSECQNEVREAKRRARNIVATSDRRSERSSNPLPPIDVASIARRGGGRVDQCPRLDCMAIGRGYYDPRAGIAARRASASIGHGRTRRLGPVRQGRYEASALGRRRKTADPRRGPRA